MAVIRYSIKGDTLDDVIYRHYGYSQGALEIVLEANKDIEKWEVLPTSTAVIMPTIEVTQTKEEEINLWN